MGLKIGVNNRFDGDTGDINAEMIEVEEDGSTRNATSRQVLRRNKRRADKALIKMLKDEARKMRRAAGGAALNSREDARRVFADMLARGEKPLKDEDAIAAQREAREFRHPWQR